MGITQRTYLLTSPLEPSEVLRRVEKLLSSEGVSYKSNATTLVSTGTPLAVLGIQGRLYTRRNWLGINPFTHVSKLQLTCESRDGRTNLILQIDRTRAVLFALFWAACGYFTAVHLPAIGVLLLVAALAAVAWFQIAVVGGSLVAKELEAGLATSLGAA
jgi:hypothetical protein